MEIKTTYLPLKYIFIVHSYQLAILSQFNDFDSQTYGDISTATKISEQPLKMWLGVLVKQKVLLKPEDDGDEYLLNLSKLSRYPCKLRRQC
jgi:cullin 1